MRWSEEREGSTRRSRKSEGAGTEPLKRHLRALKRKNPRISLVSSYFIARRASPGFGSIRLALKSPVNDKKTHISSILKPLWSANMHLKLVYGLPSKAMKLIGKCRKFPTSGMGWGSSWKDAWS